MKVTVSVKGKTHSATRPFPKADHVVLTIPCPFCGVEPMKARGVGGMVKSHDSYRSDAITTCCGKPLDWIKATFDTIFGLEEDERVLNGPWRVYR